LSIVHPNIKALDAFKSFIDANYKAFFDETSNFDNNKFNSLKSKYKSFLDEKIYYRIEGVSQYKVAFQRSDVNNIYKNFKNDNNNVKTL
jgi:hypothetical protein